MTILKWLKPYSVFGVDQSIKVRFNIATVAMRHRYFKTDDRRYNTNQLLDERCLYR